MLYTSMVFQNILLHIGRNSRKYCLLSTCGCLVISKYRYQHIFPWNTYFFLCLTFRMPLLFFTIYIYWYNSQYTTLDCCMHLCQIVLLSLFCELFKFPLLIKCRRYKRQHGIKFHASIHLVLLPFYFILEHHFLEGILLRLTNCTE